jgi:hypothetical protein
LFQKQIKIAKLVCECWAKKKNFFQLISIDSVEKVHLDILSNSVVIFSKKDLSIATIKKEVFGLQIYEMT